MSIDTYSCVKLWKKYRCYIVNNSNFFHFSRQEKRSNMAWFYHDIRFYFLEKLRNEI